MSWQKHQPLKKKIKRQGKRKRFQSKPHAKPSVYHRRSVSILVASDFTSSSSMESKISNLQSFSASFNAYRQIWSTNHLRILSQASSSQFVQQKVLWLRLVWAACLKSVLKSVHCDGTLSPRIRVELAKQVSPRQWIASALLGKSIFHRNSWLCDGTGDKIWLTSWGD